MKQTKIKQSQKGFTLIEVLLVIVLIGILISIGLVTFNAEARFIDARNDIRKTHIQTLEGSITQYKLQEGNYPTGLDRNYQEICDPEATDCIGFFDLKQFLVPTYLQAIPQDPNDDNTTEGAGYSVAVDAATNTVSVRALQAEGGEIIAINDPLPAEGTVTSNTPLAATVPVTPPQLPIVTNGLVLNLDAGNPASYPGTGNTWFDLSGNNNNGTLVNGVGYNSANGGRLVFDGVNDYVNLGNSLVFNQSGGKSFTITCWALFNTATQNHNPVFNKAATNGTWEYTLGLSNSRSVSWLTSSNGTSWISRGVNETISLGIWYYYAVGYDFVNQVTFASINGKQIYTSSQTGIFNGSRAFEIGRHNDPVTTMNGSISNLNFYNRALTPEEIQQNFNATRGRFGL